jgi:hypothetical protein
MQCSHLNLAILAATVALTGCASESWQNVRAPEFNAFLNRIQAECQPLWIGSMQLSDVNAGSDNATLYANFIDNTSRLFYGRIDAATYRDSIFSFASDSATRHSVDCIISKLPADRPTKPTGSYGY